MSAGTLSGPSPSDAVRTRAQSHAGSISVPFQILKMLGSLKITVTMFGLGILLVLFGTLAQDEQSLAEVKRLYFNSWLAIVPVDVLFPVTLFPHDAPYPGRFPFPGGATIGLILMINLIAAKTTRFSAQAKGMRLLLGIVVSLIGAFLVTAVIVSGHAVDGLQGKPPVSYDTLWAWLKGGCAIMTLALVGYAITAKGLPNLARILLGLTAVLSVALTASLLFGGTSLRLNDPGLRIVWQLLQATIASGVTLAGLWIIFGNRGGNVLIHVGVALLMVGQFVFGDRQVEQRLSVVEGQKTNLVFRQDELELAFVDTSDTEEDHVLAISEAHIRKVLRGDGVIDVPQLPCKVKIVQWMPNSSFDPLKADEKSPATVGLGLQMVAKPMRSVGAAESNSINIASAYIELIDRETNQAIETLLVTQHANDRAQIYLERGKDIVDAVTIGSKPFDVALRYRREYKPYSVELEDVVRVNYSGSDTARDFSSHIVIHNHETGETLKGRTWMNNPLRYQGETFYQSSYYNIPTAGGGVVEAAGLQVVENAGWVIPYICCMMVLVGMFAHFGGTFVTFANRYDRGSIPTGSDAGAKGQARPKLTVGRVIPIVLGLGTAAACASMFARPEPASVATIDWKAISELPVQHEGRIKPFDTVARYMLQNLSDPLFGGKGSVKDKAGNSRTPSEWLMATLAGAPWAREAPVFRIYSKEVLDIFELDPRPGSCYSYAEMEPGREAFMAALEPLRESFKNGKELGFREQKLAELNSKLNAHDFLALAYREQFLPQATGDDLDAVNTLLLRVKQTQSLMQRIAEEHPPALIPPAGQPDENGLIAGDWQALGPATFNGIMVEMRQVMGPELFSTIFQPLDDSAATPNPGTALVATLLTAVQENKAADVNKAVRALQKHYEATPASAPHLTKASTERWLNKFNPTAQGVVLYLLAMSLGFATFLINKPILRRTTFWLLVGVFVIHTVALLARMYISGRAPVINLYSSAVFIGWACVLFCLALELIYPIGVANLVAGLIGIVTLCIAQSLDTSDTLHVLQAVLDTQFWLSTHVVTVTIGYAVTFLAGFLGICALVHRIATGYDGLKVNERPPQTENFQKILYRMGYGAVCFGIFFSFVGTVLGGLWADDSWGRFWGWDPKENGALMIVMWNAIVLHARWDKQVGPRGFAILTMIGNIVTAWSWFGTNLLGIGLHNYGFNQGVAYALVITVVLHAGLILFSLIFTQVLSKRIAKT